jgi:hypothetical protein
VSWTGARDEFAKILRVRDLGFMIRFREGANKFVRLRDEYIRYYQVRVYLLLRSNEFIRSQTGVPASAPTSERTDLQLQD